MAIAFPEWFKKQLLDHGIPQEPTMSQAVENLKRFVEHIDSFSEGIRPHDDMPVKNYVPHSWLTVGDLREVLRLAQKATDNPVRRAIETVIINKSGYALPPTPCCAVCGSNVGVKATGTPHYRWECQPCGRPFN